MLVSKYNLPPEILSHRDDSSQAYDTVTDCVNPNIKPNV